MKNKYLIVFLYIFYCSQIFSANKTFTGPGNFSDATRWGGTLPVAGDNLFINGNCIFDNSANNLAYGTLSIGGGSAGELSWPASGTNTLSITDFLTAKNNSSVNMTNGGFLQIRNSWAAKNITFTPGTGTFIWNVSTANSLLPNSISIYYNLITATGSNLVSLNVGAGTTISNNLTVLTGTLNSGNNSFTCNNTVFVTSVLTDNSNAGNNILNHMVINSGGKLYSTIGETYSISGNLTMLGGSITGSGTPIIDVAGNFLVTSNTNDIGNAQFSVVGTTSISAVLNISTINGNKTLNDFSVSSAGSFSCGVSESWAIGGNITVNGSLTANAGTYSLTGIGKTISGTTAMTFSNVTCSGTYTNNANVTLRNSLIGAGIWNQGSTGILNLALLTPSLSVTNFNASAVGNTVNYSRAGNQTIRNPNDGSYYHLSTSTSGTKTFSVNTIVGGNVAITSSTLDVSATNFSLSVAGNWVNTAGLFMPRSATVTFNGLAPQTIFKSGGEIFNNLIFINAGSKTLLSAITGSNVTISSGSSLNVNTTNNQVSVRGNFINNGSFIAQKGLVMFNGTIAQSIGGTVITNFYNLSLNNNAGASLSFDENLINALTISNGTFNTNGRVFTMISTASATARIAPITGTGDIIGNVTVQRYAPGGYTGWALLGTPISSGLTFQSWNDDFAISCSSCPNGTAGGFTSIYAYDETATGSYSASTSYIPISSITDPIVPNTGYWVYLGNGQTSTTGITIDVTGTVRKFDNSIPVTRTNNGTEGDDGWNLIHNPYPSPIRWSLLRNGNTSVDNAIYGYNADLNGGAGGIVTFVNGISSPSYSSGGISDTIPMCQAFQVHCSASTLLTALESNKVSANPKFVKINQSSQVTSAPGLLRLNLFGPSSFRDETVLYIQSSATDSFDVEFDAIKINGQNPNAPMIMLQNEGKSFQINAVSPIVSTFTMPVKTTTGYSGTYTISATNFNSFPSGACISLYDNETGTTTNLKTSAYTFTMNSTTVNPRFILNITINSLDITTNLSQPNCTAPSSGEITAIGNNSGPWNYLWKDVNGITLKTSLNKNSADTLVNLSGGNYLLEISTVGQCDNRDSTFTVNVIETPLAQFNSADTTYLSNNGLIEFSNTSTNAASNSWDFGDGFGFSVNSDPAYNYISAGIYTVTLIVSSNSGCADTTYKSIVVEADMIVTNLLSEDFNSSLILSTLDQNEFLLSGIIEGNDVLNFKLIDGLGKLVKDYGVLKSDAIYLPINLNDYQAGIYYLNVIGEKLNKTIKLPVK